MTKGAKLLKQIRSEKNLTQSDIEKFTHIPRSTIACIESVEGYKTSVPTAKTLGEFLNIKWYLFFEEGSDE